MRIGEVAKAAGVGVETIRFYERKGLIAQPLKPVDGGFRSYPARTASVVQFIKQAQDLGFSLQEVADLLSLKADPMTDCGDVLERARVKLNEVEDKLARLERMHQALEDLIAACPGKGTVCSCSIISALDGNGAPTKESQS